MFNFTYAYIDTLPTLNARATHIHLALMILSLLGPMLIFILLFDFVEKYKREEVVAWEKWDEKRLDEEELERSLELKMVEEGKETERRAQEQAKVRLGLEMEGVMDEKFAVGADLGSDDEEGDGEGEGGNGNGSRDGKGGGNMRGHKDVEERRRRFYRLQVENAERRRVLYGVNGVEEAGRYLFA